TILKPPAATAWSRARNRGLPASRFSTRPRARVRPSQKAREAPVTLARETTAAPTTTPKREPAARVMSEPGRTRQARAQTAAKTTGPQAQPRNRPRDSPRASRRGALTERTIRPATAAAIRLSSARARRVSAFFMTSPECSRLLPNDRPCRQGRDDPERQIDQQQVDREHRPAVLKPEVPRAAHRQEKQKQGRHRREDVEKP